uniref:Fibronectin domain-containing protein n=1 Tax=Pristionchus pacificus TaxID=54126 RepID=A0A2A6C5H8_PRIPA|eukprot:PDM73390.1 Fibronectin domain-containing protein [Pristionchus pacificus]
MGAPTALLLLFLATTVLLPTVTSFVILPYVQIDYAYYFRLAQCQAKCTQKYGIAGKLSLNDGSTTEQWDNTSEDMQQCALGCEQPRKGVRARSLPSARIDGTKFWDQSAAAALAEKSSSSSPISRVNLLCQNVAPLEKSGFADSIEGLIGVEMAKHVGPVRLLLQWKHRQVMQGVVIDGGASITASIESSPIFKVEGMQPGTQYLFTVTAIGPNGKLGEAVSSQWFEAIHTEKTPDGAVTTRSGHSASLGVTAMLSWTRAHIDSCHYRVTVKNATHTDKRDVTIDTSPGLLLTHLEMDSEYEIAVASSDVVATPFPRPLVFLLKTYTCAQIFGRGSLQCPPEPVDELVVSVRPNGTAHIAWKPSADASQVLTYEILAQPIAPCDAPPNHIFLNAASSSAQLQLGETRPCEYAIRVTNYDLVGRDSSRETRVVMPMAGKLFSANVDGLIAAGAATFLVLFLLLTCKCCMSCRGRRNERVHGWKGVRLRIDCGEIRVFIHGENSTSISTLAKMKSNMGESRDYLFVDQDALMFAQAQRCQANRRRFVCAILAFIVTATLMSVFYLTTDEPLFDRSAPDLSEAALLAKHAPHFVQFTRRFNKQYESEDHAQVALKNYAKQMEEVERLNEGLDVPQYGENEMSDWSDEEFAKTLLPLDFYETMRSINEEEDEEFISRMPKNLQRALVESPKYDHFDWRAYNVVTPVKAQGKCGSCWAFAATATVESAWLIKNPQDTRILSEQTLLDCDLSNDACGGGDEDKAFRFIHRQGLAYLADYPYVAHRQNNCLADSFRNRTKIDVAYFLNPDEKSMIDWLTNFGPVNIGMSVIQPMRSWNSSEIFYPTKEQCKNEVIGLHAMLIVGYGTSDAGVPYWIIKNSWGQSYGTEGGFIYYRRGVNACFVEDEPVGILA